MNNKRKYAESFKVKVIVYRKHISNYSSAPTVYPADKNVTKRRYFKPLLCQSVTVVTRRS